MFKEEFVSPVLFRKSLLALAITTCALPVHAQTLQLTDAGLTLERQQFSENVEITGSMNHAQEGVDALHILGSDFAKDLVFNATITSSNSSGGGIDMDSWYNPNPSNGDVMWANNTVGGNLINKGSVSSQGNGATAWLIDPAVVGGDVINEGLLSAKGEPDVGEDDRDVSRAAYISGSTHINGDFKNTASGKIIAEGTDAKAFQMEGGQLDGRFINNGLIQVTGVGSTAVDVTSSEA